MPGEKPSRSAPTSDLLWGHDDPRFGVDEDRPGIARIRLHGAVARWVAGSVWHPKQEDTWLVEGSRLERRLPYRSCRELARRLAGVADGIESIEPRELLIEVTSLAQRAAGLGA
jgi:predicted DNA-binding transcriptional regulator YafY